MEYAKQLPELFKKLHQDFFKDTPDNLYQPVAYAMQSGGKYIRPLLMIYANELFGGKQEDVVCNAYGIELFHNFTLVHDDIMDHAAIRRGKPTVFKKFGLNAGILSGDFMFIKSLQLCVESDSQYRMELFDLISKTAIEIHEGQQMDVDFESQDMVSEEEYIQMICYKTAVLLACSLQMGAIIAGTSKKNQELLYEFGRLIGIAFQIQDDYLDSFGDQQVGKRIGGDILNNKKTLLYISSVKLASSDDRVKLIEWYQQQTSSEDAEITKISEVKEIFTRSGAKEYCKDQMNKYLQAGLDCLHKVESDYSKSKLLSIADLITKREL